MLGEFGRTPKINKAAGRDHWGACQSVVLAGGGIRGGQVYGSSDAARRLSQEQSRLAGRRDRHDVPRPGHSAATA